MHVIIYTLRGLLESHLTDTASTGHLNIIDAVSRAADALCDAAERHTVNSTPWMIPTSFDADWKSRDAHSCLTGNAQFACFLFRLAATTGNGRYRTVAERVLQVTERTQLLDTTFRRNQWCAPGKLPPLSRIPPEQLSQLGNQIPGRCNHDENRFRRGQNGEAAVHHRAVTRR